MTVFLAILLTVLAFAFITYPLFKRKAQPLDDSPGDQETRELLSRRDTARSMLKELEFDYQSGILNEEDYHNLENRYKSKAAEVMKDMDKTPAKGTDEGTGKVADIEDEIENQVRQIRRSRGRFCPRCGAGRKEGDRFCSRCGAPLEGGGNKR